MGIAQSSFEYDVAGNRIKRFAIFSSGNKPNNWRWKADLGDEAGNTWLSPLNVTSIISMQGAVRLRMSTVLPNGSAAAQSICLQYSTEPPTNPSAAWTTVPTGDPATHSAPFVIESGYAGSLTNGTSTTAQLSTPYIAQTGTADALAASFQSGGKVISSSSNCFNFVGTTAGRYEFEYRIAFTKNATPGQVYYFRQQSATSGLANSYEYDGGFPSIGISPGYNGVPDKNLPNISIAVGLPSNSMAFLSGETKNMTLMINNLSPTLASTNSFIGTFVQPTGWVLAPGSLPTGWTLSGNTLTGTTSIPASGTVTIPLTLQAPTTMGGGVVTFSLGNMMGNAGGDGTGYNNRSSIAVYKP